MAAIAVSILFALPSTAVADGDLAIGATTYFESGLMEGEERISTQERDESFDFRNGNFFSARLAYFRSIGESFHVGGGFDFMAIYRAEFVEEDPDPDDPPEYYEFGTLLEGMALAEWRIGLGESSRLGLGAQAGAVVLFPRGDFDEDIRELQDQDVPVWRVPRPGFGGGAHAAFLWDLDDRLSVRTEAGVLWQRVFLFRTTTTVDDVAFRKRWTSTVLRGRIGVSLQVRL